MKKSIEGDGPPIPGRSRESAQYVSAHLHWGTPMRVLLAIAALVYALSPYDLMPDFLVGLGWLDDLVILWVVWSLFYRQKTRMGADAFDHRHRSRPESDGKSSERGFPGRDHHDGKIDPYHVLGIADSASGEEIRKAYRTLANMYHPDKVAHLGEEFRILAERRFKEIQSAYSMLAERKNGRSSVNPNR